MPALDNRPSLEGFEWFWIAFTKLETCRQNGMGPGPIPWNRIQQYAAVQGLTPEETYILEEVIMGVDAEYLNKILGKGGDPPKESPEQGKVKQLARQRGTTGGRNKPRR